MTETHCCRVTEISVARRKNLWQSQLSLSPSLVAFQVSFVGLTLGALLYFTEFQGLALFPVSGICRDPMPRSTALGPTQANEVVVSLGKKYRVSKSITLHTFTIPTGS